MSEQQWQPIETAPKDGTEIIVGFDFATVWIVHLAFWRDGAELEAQGVGDWRSEDTGWWSYVLGSVTQEQLDGSRTPTHWMPCPRIPTRTYSL